MGFTTALYVHHYSGQYNGHQALCHVRRARLLIAGLSDMLAGLCVFCRVLLRCSLFGNSSAFAGSASRSAAFSRADGLLFPELLSEFPEPEIG